MPYVEPLEPPWVVAFHRFWSPFSKAFQEAFPDDARVHDVSLLADLILDGMFDPVELTLRPASKQEVFAEFIEPFDGDELLEHEEPRTVAMAELGLELLIQRQMVVIDGNQITLHHRIMDTITTDAQASG